METNSTDRRGQRSSKTQFKKGATANPGGRPKGHAHVRELARQHTEESISALVAVVNDSENAMARVRAADILLCRGWGNPEQVVENRTSLAEVIETAKRRTAVANSTLGTVVPFPPSLTVDDTE
jgi:hypothetical protein